MSTEAAPRMAATLEDGPLEGRTIGAEMVEGRPPKTIDVPADDGSTCRYCLADWVQSGGSAAYTFLYTVYAWIRRFSRRINAVCTAIRRSAEHPGDPPRRCSADRRLTGPTTPIHPR